MFEARNGDTSIMPPDAVKHSQHFCKASTERIPDMRW